MRFRVSVPPGIKVPAGMRAVLKNELAALEGDIKKITTARGPLDAMTAALAPEILIFHKAAHDALRYQEFHAEKEIVVAFELIREGRARAAVSGFFDTTL